MIFELVNTSSEENTNVAHNTSKKESNINKKVKTVTDKLDSSSAEVKDLYKELDDYLLSLGDDVQKKILMHYIAYRRLKNFASVQFYNNKILIYVNVDADSITLENGFTRDMRNIGHYGTGKLEITIKNLTDLEKAKTLIEKSFANS